jgi:hypothetical protein
MNWLCIRLREWLGVDTCISGPGFVAYQEGQQQLIEALQSQLTEFKEALKKRAALSPAVRVNVMDYESAQVDALKDFKEK